MSKEPKTRVSQLPFTFGLPRDEAQAAEQSTPIGSQSAPRSNAEVVPETRATDTGRATSIVSSSAGTEPERKKKWHSLIDKVYAPANLRRAWERVAANKGAGGVDGMTITTFSKDVDRHLAELSADLRQKTYRPKPVRRVYITKSGGGHRPLGIPTVRDRIVQQSLLQVLEPIFDPAFSNRSHGFRPERGCATALRVVDQAVRWGYEWVVDADIQSFFDQVDHERLLTALNEEVADGSVLGLIRRILKAGVLLPEASAGRRTPASGPDERRVEPTEIGTPQGGPLSPLLANIYLHAFDTAITAAGFGLVRYADDFVIFARSESEAARALALCRQVLEEQWGLRLHPEKTRVVSVSAGFEFLGFHYFRDSSTGELRKLVRRKSVSRFRDSIRALSPRLIAQRRLKLRHLTYKRLSRNPRLQAMIQGMNLYLRGWHWYFKSVWSAHTTPFRDFDGFVRRRLRASIAGRHGRGVLNWLLPNKMLAALGLISLDGLHQQYCLNQLAAPVREDRPGGEPYAGKPHVRFGREGTWVTCP